MKGLLMLLLAWGCTIGVAHAQTAQEADSLHQLGRTLMNEGKLAEAREATRQAMEMRKTLFGEVNEDYITSLNNYALTFFIGEDYAQAETLQAQVLKLCEQLPTQHKNLGMFTTNMGRICYMEGNKQQAAAVWERALPLVEKFGELYKFLLESLAMIYNDLGDKANLERLMRLTQEYNEEELKKPCDDPQCLMEHARLHADTGDNAKAKECYLRALDMPLSDEEKAALHAAYAYFLAMHLRDYETATTYALSAAETWKLLRGEQLDYAQQMRYAALFSYFAKQYEPSIRYFRPVIAYHERMGTPADLKAAANCWKNVGNDYNAMKQYAQAKECYQRVADYYAQHDPQDEEYPKALLRVAKAEKWNKEYDASIAHHQQVMQLFEERGMMEDYADAANSLSTLYLYAKREGEVDTKDEAVKAAQDAKLDGIIREELESLELTRTYLGQLTYARSLGTIASCYAMKEDYAKALEYYRQYMPAIREAIRDAFRLQNEAERMATWQEEKSHIEELQELLVTLPTGHEALMADLTAVVYDAELLSKGILLHSSIEFEKVLAAQGDASLTETYAQTKANEAEIERLRTTASTEAELEKLLALMQQNQRLQLHLYQGCAAYADFTNYIAYDWHDVQQQLEPTDVAVEFAAIKTSVFDNENYMAALVLTSDMERPVALPVCSLADAKAMETFDQLFDQDNWVWGALANYLRGKRRLFFSADGAFNRIGIEYLLFDGTPLSEQFEVYRLSSTKELCMHHPHADYRKAALFGDIDYNGDATTSAATAQALATLRTTAGNQFANLENTRLEINEIQSILQRGNVTDIVKLTDTEASTSAFMYLTDTNVNLLHIATHGAFLDQTKQSDRESMDNSLLAFAGANLGDGQGLVTAAEVATMNLRQCDLAVLSACETGLGKLSDDGVFGLQRGFKNAGVHTLLMSLKPVYDTSTAELMIAFYRHLIGHDGCSKREALVRAQQELRAKGFKEPQYWATFILLDALEK